MNEIRIEGLDQNVECHDPYKGVFSIKLESLYKGLQDFCVKIKNERIVYLNDFYRLLNLETIKIGDYVYFDYKKTKDIYPIRLAWHVIEDGLNYVELEYIHEQYVFVK